MKNLLAAGIVMTLALITYAIETCREKRISLFGKCWLMLMVTSLAALMLVLTLHFAHARDLGQWDATDAATREWRHR